MSFICFDTEDDSRELLATGKSGFDKQMTQVAAIKRDGSKFYGKGKKQKEFLQWLQVQPEKFIYAHNLQYDLGNLFSKKLDCLDITMVGGRLIKAVWGKKVFVDSFNIWPMSAKKLGEKFGLEKMEFDANSKAYVYRDVEIIQAAMEFAWKFCDSIGLDYCPPTLGGLCVKVWKSWLGENCHDSSELSREAYYGGRVELFKRVNDADNVAYTDINSLYPAMMLKNFPARCEDWTGKKALPLFGVARVKIKLPKTEIGILPCRAQDGRIYYGYGTVWGVWTVLEINAAVERGGKIIEVAEVWGTNESIKPYSKFVETLYSMRLSANSEAEKLFFKLLMNNLYGRLGSGGEIGRSVWQTEKNRDDGIPYGQKILVKYKMPLSEETNWLHAAYVTSYGRLCLLEYLELIGADKMIYCDTDSCIFDCANKQLPFEVSLQLGKMKLESWQTCVETYAPKMYKLGKKFKAKGVPVRLAEKYITTGKAEFSLPFKMRESIRFYDRKNLHELSVWRNVVKQNRVTYDRKKLKDNRFYPCNLSNLV